MQRVRDSFMGAEPTFIVISGEGENRDLSKALNKGIVAAVESGLPYVGWIHADMDFPQLNWHLPLVDLLVNKRSVLKACAANARDPSPEGFRLDQEQCWLMRCSDFEKYPGLFFDEDFLRIGGFEDWYQSFVIITSGRLVLVDPRSQVYHHGMQTRMLKDTVAEQQQNGHVFTQKTGLATNPHSWDHFASKLTRKQKEAAIRLVTSDFPEFNACFKSN